MPASAGPELHLLLEPLLLVNGVVELGEGVAHLTAADEQLKPLGEPGVLGRPLGQGGDIHRVHGDESGLNEHPLHLLVKALVEGVAPGGLHPVHVDAHALGGGHGRLVAVDGHEVHPQVLLDRLGHGQPGPARGQADLLPLPGDLIGPQDLLGGGGEEGLKQVHHVVEVGIGLIELHGGKLRVVLGIHALVAENATDLVHPLQAAHDQAL